jgi:transcriptional regulator with XRE-family HTH domain
MKKKKGLAIQLLQGLRPKMKEKGISLNALAKRAGISRTALTMIKGGQTAAPRIDVVCAIVDVVGYQLVAVPKEEVKSINGIKIDYEDCN